MASSSSSRQDESPPSPEEATRDWMELPRDALLTVLHRLGHVDILMGTAQVCGPWARAARDEPELWRRVDLRFHGGLSSRRQVVDLNRMAREAVIRGAGQCEAFWGERALDHSVLSLLGDTAALSLKSLHLISCGWINDVPLALTITKFTHLEELELSNCCGDFPETCAAAGKACPLPTRLRLSSKRFVKHSLVPADGGGDGDRHEHARAAVAAALHETPQRPRPGGHPRWLPAPGVARHHPPLLQHRDGRRDAREVLPDRDAEAPPLPRGTTTILSSLPRTWTTRDDLPMDLRG